MVYKVYASLYYRICKIQPPDLDGKQVLLKKETVRSCGNFLDTAGKVYYNVPIKRNGLFSVEEMLMGRISKENYYLDIAETVLERATCLRRVYGAIIVKNDEIISTGYNGAPRGRKNCADMGYCTREALRVPRGERYELCRSVHAEANAIISAGRRDMVGGTIYLVGRNAQTGELLNDATSCSMCRRLVINAGLSKIVIRKTPTEFEVVDVQEWVENDDSLPAGIEFDC